MKKISQQIEDLLLDYIDGNTTEDQRAALEKSLKENPDLRSRFDELQAIHASLKRQHLEVPSKTFTASVMNKLDQFPARSGLSLRNGIFLLLGIFAVLGITMILLSAGVFDEKTTFDLNNISLVNRYIKQSLPTIPVSGKLIVNTIILLNLALAFVVLDRAILRPLFNRRMQTGH